jgi:hypothetical protein
VTDVRVKAIVCIGLTLIAVAVALTLAQSPLMAVRPTGSQLSLIETVRHQTRVCQRGEELPSGISAIRLRVFTFLGPRVVLDALADGHIVAHGERGSGWTGGAVTVPVNSPSQAASGVTLCFTLLAGEDEDIELIGQPAATPVATANGQPLGGRVAVEYMRPGPSSWWSLATVIARRIGWGRAEGAWSAYAAIVLMFGVVAASSYLTLRRLG